MYDYQVEAFEEAPRTQDPSSDAYFSQFYDSFKRSPGDENAVILYAFTLLIEEDSALRIVSSVMFPSSVFSFRSSAGYANKYFSKTGGS